MRVKVGKKSWRPRERARLTRPKMRALLLLAALLGPAAAFCPQFLQDNPTCSCFAYTDGAVIKCTGNDGPGMVERLKAYPAIIRELTIENANIVEIGPRAFRNLQIKNLKLDYNRIQTIHPDAFRGLERTMISLSLTHNKLTEVPTDALTGMLALNVLNLQCNNIGDIFGSVFRNVSSLIELNLACNQICKIQGGAFDETKDTLQSLILDQNCLSEIPSKSLVGFKHLLGLHVQYNALRNVTGGSLSDLPSLLILKLAGNNINHMDEGAFVQIPNLRYLYLDRNEIFNLQPGYFQKFKQLEILDLSYNQIAEIPPNAFRGMDTLMQLKLEGNNIRDIGPNAFSKTPLLLLLLSDNCLTSISRTIFSGIPFLRQLSLSGNTISSLQPYSFSQLPNLHILDLANNMLKTVEPSMVVASTHVTVLLQENPLACAQEGFHIMQGGQPIHLLSEPNLVCNGTRPAICSSDRPRPETPACCQPFEPTTPAPAVLSTPSPVYSTLRPPIRRRGGRFRNRTRAPRTTPVPGVTGGKSINMDRFWRLQDKSSLLRRREPAESDPLLAHRIRRPAEEAVLPIQREIDEEVKAGEPQFFDNGKSSELPPALVGIPRVEIPPSQTQATAVNPAPSPEILVDAAGNILTASQPNRVKAVQVGGEFELSSIGDGVTAPSAVDVGPFAAGGAEFPRPVEVETAPAVIAPPSTPQEVEPPRFIPTETRLPVISEPETVQALPSPPIQLLPTKESQPRLLLPPGVSHNELNPLLLANGQFRATVPTVPAGVPAPAPAAAARESKDYMAPEFIGDSAVLAAGDESRPDWVPEQFAGFEQLPPWMQDRLSQLEVQRDASTALPPPPASLVTKPPKPALANLPLKPTVPRLAGSEDFSFEARPKVQFSQDASDRTVVDAVSDLRVEGEFKA